MDLIRRIFIRIPIKLLLRARCVSKSWCQVIDDPVFAQMQYECCQLEQNTLILRASKDSRTVQTTSLYAATGCNSEEGRMILPSAVPMVKFQTQYHQSIYDYGSCNGLLYFVADCAGQFTKFVVSNPLKSQFTILPPPPILMLYGSDSEHTATGLGFDSLTKTFKMVYTNKKLGSPHLRVTLVHTLGTTSWREVPSVLAYYCKPIDYNNSVFVHGFLHWMTDPSKMKNCEGQILAFDVSKETFKVFTPPEISFKEHRRYYRILDIKGNLGLLDLSHRVEFDIWIMDHEKLSWSKEYIIDMTVVGNIYVNSTNFIGLWKRDEILFCVCNRDLSRPKHWSYCMRTGIVKECEDQGADTTVYSLYSVKGSLISFPPSREVS